MQDSEDRPQRHSALVARELARLDIVTAALGEVRFAEQGSLLEDGAGFTLFWSGKNKDERRLSGVGFMIKTSVARKLQNLPDGHSDRIMSLRLPIQDNKFAPFLDVYAPAGVKEAFYRDLHNLLQQFDSKDKLFTLGDFNARVGRDFELWRGVLVDTELATAMTTGVCCCSSVPSNSSSSPTPCFSRRIGSRQRGDTHAPNTGTSWTTS